MKIGPYPLKICLQSIIAVFGLLLNETSIPVPLGLIMNKQLSYFHEALIALFINNFGLSNERSIAKVYLYRQFNNHYNFLKRVLILIHQ